MKLMDRITLLAKADAHGVVESLEDRALLLKQHVREAEMEVDRKRARLEALENEHRRIGEETERLSDRSAALEADIALAMNEDKEELARYAIKKLLPLRAAAERLESRGQQVGSEKDGLAEQLSAQQRELDELKNRVRADLAAAKQRAASDLDLGFDSYVVTDEDVEMELLRRRRGGAA